MTDGARTVVTSDGIALEAELATPSDGPPRAGMVLCHPHPQYGGTMHTKVVYQSAKALSRIGCAVLRFNFRGVGTSAGRFADGVGAAPTAAPRSTLGGASYQTDGLRVVLFLATRPLELGEAEVLDWEDPLGQPEH